MAGVEIFGLIASAASLADIVMRGSERLERVKKELKDFENVNSHCETLIKRLRSLYTTTTMTFSRFKEEMEDHLDPRDQVHARQLLQDVSDIFDRSEDTIRQLRREMNRKNNKANMDNLRQELRDESQAIQDLNTQILTLVTFDMSRRMSEGASTGKGSSKAPAKLTPLSRSSTADSTGSSSQASSSKGKSVVKPPPRTDTSLSGTTLVRRPTQDSAISGSLSSPSFVSTGSSTSSTQTVQFTDNKQLRAAVEEKNLTLIQQLIGDAKTPNEVESRKASALILACRYRRVEIIEHLLTIGTSLDITDDKGQGVLHRTIGDCDIIDENRAKQTAIILKLLVDAGAQVQAIEDPGERKTPLHFCAKTSNHYAAHYLLSKNPNMVNMIDASNKTALYHACEQPSPNEKLVKLLLEKRATFAKKGRPELKNRPAHQKIRKLLDDAERQGRSLSC